MGKSKKADKKSSIPAFPPVITVLGHVDHGKTSLLDAIRKTDIVKGEHGGITQKIGASTIEIDHEGKKRPITFIDTPGHEAFSQMRSRGARVADIALLIVSSVDGVMPQTVESIKLLQVAKLPFIVVFTKADVDGKITEKAKQQLLKEGVMLEGLGGDVPYIEVSAKTNLNIKELLGLILLIYDMHPELQSSKEQFEGIIIESRLDQKAGPKATMVVRNGIVVYRDELISEGVEAKVRALISDRGQVSKASKGMAVEVLGFGKVPPVGALVYKKGHEAAVVAKEPEGEKEPPKDPLAPILTPYFIEKEKSVLLLVLAADTLGSLEAIVQSLPTKNVAILAQKTGEISEADVMMGKSTGAIVLGFNTKIRPEVQKLAMQEKVLMKNYTIIYEMLSEIQDVLEGKQLALEEKIYGKAQVLASFPFDKSTVFGIKVLEGRIAKGDKVRIERKNEPIGEATITSLRIGKNPSSKVESGAEAGIILNSQLDITIGDVILSHS